MNRGALILVIVAFVGVLAVAFRYSRPPGSVIVLPAPQPTVTLTSGLLKHLREPSFLSSSSLRHGTVVLANGASVDASVSPACVVQVGQPVQIYVLSWSGVKVYLVAGAK